MNFDITKSEIIPFSLTDKEIFDKWIDFLIRGNDVPVDIAYKSVIKSAKKEYYPVRCFNITCSAEWNAISIYEHRESYTEYQPKTVYYDMDGKEHDKPGADYTDITGKYSRPSISSDAVKRPWTPQQKYIPVTKYKTVIDSEEPTYGKAGPITTFQPIITYAAANADFAKWVVSFSTKGHTRYDQTLIEYTDVKDLIETDAYAKKTAVSRAMDIISERCKTQVPGNRYKGLTITGFDYTSDMTIYLYPVYCITYTYNNKEYKCWLGGNGSSGFFYSGKPVDENLHEKNKERLEVLKRKKSFRFKFGLGTFVGMPIVLLIAFAASIARGFGAFGLAVTFLAQIVMIGVFCVLFVDVRNYKDYIENSNKEKQKIKTDIAEIVKATDIGANEKQQRIQQALNQQQ